jgi:hypothetical protein
MPQKSGIDGGLEAANYPHMEGHPREQKQSVFGI